MRYRLLIFDRDGTLCYEHGDYHRDLSSLWPYPFTGPLLRELQAAGYRLAVATNQSGVARGYWTLAEVDAVHQRFVEEWEVMPAFYVCPHHPDEGCPCRKPRPGLLEAALEEHQVRPEEALMVGDSPADRGAAHAMSLDFALVLTGVGRHTREKLPEPPILTLDTVAELRAHLL